MPDEPELVGDDRQRRTRGARIRRDMPALAFLPWCTVREPAEFAGFRLVPHRLAQEGTDRTAIDSVLEVYRDGSGRRIESATLVQSPGRDVTHDLADDEIERVFELAEALKMAGLARRGFFSVSDYCNADTFMTVVQRFPAKGAHGVAITSRRRDGLLTQSVHAPAYEERRPHHVEVHRYFQFDADVVRALLAVRSAGAGDVEEAVLSFNLANTDSDQIRSHVELVLLSGAFERLLGCASGNENELASALARQLAGIRLAEVPDGARLRFLRKRFTRGDAAEMWVRDLFRLRGSFAHGRRLQVAPTIWDADEHLLLGAYLFPRLLLVKLNELGFYRLSEADRDELYAFPCLLRLRRPMLNRFDGRNLWGQALYRAKLRRDIERVLEAQAGGAG